MGFSQGPPIKTASDAWRWFRQESWDVLQSPFQSAAEREWRYAAFELVIWPVVLPWLALVFLCSVLRLSFGARSSD